MTWHVKEQADNGHVECSLIGKSPTVYIEPMPKEKIELLMAAYPHQEWLGYLKGRISEKQNVFVEDLSIPPHKEASAASAEAEPFHIPKDCVGIIHSHHSMGAFHSGTDAAFVDKNFPVSVTVAKRNAGLEYDTVSYMVTPCGKATTGKSEVKYVQPKPLYDHAEWLKQAQVDIDKGKRVYTAISMNHALDAQEYIHKMESKINQNSGVSVRHVPELTQPRDKQGHFLPKQQSYLPMRYRTQSLGEYVTDANGRVLNDIELNDILANSREV